MQGSTLPVDVTLRGLHKNEKVQLQYDLSDGQVQGEVVPFREEIHGVHYKLDLGKSFGGIHQPLTYWIIAGDAKAGPYQVDIQVVPLVAIDQIELVYPPYTKLKSRTLIQQGQLEVPEGTVASITALANQEMQKGRLESARQVLVERWRDGGNGRRREQAYRKLDSQGRSEES